MMVVVSEVAPLHTVPVNEAGNAAGMRKAEAQMTV